MIKQGMAIFLCALAWCSGSQAQPAQRLEQQQLQRQQERDRALRERMAPDVDALPGPTAASALALPDQESPCFALHEIRITGAHANALPWLRQAAGLDLRPPTLHRRPGGAGHPGAHAACAGGARLHHFAGHGRAAEPARRRARDRVPAGVLREVGFGADSGGAASVLSGLPLRPGELLQLRDIEQGLENLQRVPTADAGIEIVPSEGPDAAPGQSDLRVNYRRVHPWRMNLALDDGGTKSTGRLQGMATLSWDNPLLRNNLAYLRLGRGLRGGGDRGTRNAAFHYSVPWDYWLLGLTASSHRYHQTVAGAYEDYRYSGKASQLDARLSRVIHRSASSRTTASVRAFHRASSNFIDDTEVEVQRRRISGHELALAQRSYLGAAVRDASLAFKRGTGAFGALRAPEEPWGEGSARMKIHVVDLALGRPFQLAQRRLRFSTAFHGQWNGTPLTPQDRLAIGGRYTVRGFDGENTLLAERGRYWRNELALALTAGAEVFAALDTGRVSGPSAQYLAGQSLTGAALGVRGAGRGFSYELLVGAPVRKPEHFRTAHTPLGFNLAYSF